LPGTGGLRQAAAHARPPVRAAREESTEAGDRGGIVVPGTRPCVPLEPPAV
jgi:hypothetical protein